MGRAFIPARDVAERIGMDSAHAFHLARPWLERELGFPPPLNSDHRPHVWRPEEVEAWLAAHDARMSDPAPIEDAGPGDLMAAARTA